MAMKECSTFPKSPALLFSVISRTLVGVEGSYSSTEKQSVYSTALVDWVTQKNKEIHTFPLSISRKLM